MDLYVLRHGIPVDSGDWLGDDASRPLTENGTAELENALTALRDSGEVGVDLVLTSPAVRAHQTAQIAARILLARLEILPALAAGLGPATLMHALEGRTLPNRLMVVGHNPDLPMLVAALAGGSSLEHPLERGGLALLHGELAPGGMLLVWSKSPGQIAHRA